MSREFSEGSERISEGCVEGRAGQRRRERGTCPCHAGDEKPGAAKTDDKEFSYAESLTLHEY